MNLLVTDMVLVKHNVVDVILCEYIDIHDDTAIIRGTQYHMIVEPTNLLMVGYKYNFDPEYYALTSVSENDHYKVIEIHRKH